MSRLPNGENITNHERNGTQVTKLQVGDTRVQTNFSVAYKSEPTFLIAYR
jgi:hypothetical protein